MASPATCWRCTSRAILQTSVRPGRSQSTSRLPRSTIVLESPARSLHTTPPFALPPKKGGDPRKGAKINKPLNLRKKKAVVTPTRKPEVGARRNLRKAIVLANSNAPVLDLPELTPAVIEGPESVGQVFSIAVEDLEKLRQFEVFQKKQLWQYFYRPTTFIRHESVDIGNAMARVERFQPGVAQGEGEEGGSEIGEAEVLLRQAEEESALKVDEKELESGNTESATGTGTASEEEAKLKAINDAVARDAAKYGLDEEYVEQLQSIQQKILQAASWKEKGYLKKMARRVLNEAFTHRAKKRRESRPAGESLVRSQKKQKTSLNSWFDLKQILAQEEATSEERLKKIREIVESRDEAQLNATQKSANYVITGKAGTGKSILLLQSIVLAIQRRWVVIPISNAHDIVIGTSAYEINSETGRYVQRQYLQQFLAKIGKANADVLLSSKVLEDTHVGSHIFKLGDPLISIVDRGSGSTDYAYEAFVAFLKQLELPGAPPVLLSMDNLDYIMAKGTGYKTPEFEDVYPHDLDIVHTFLDFLSGRRKFARQMVIAATTSELHPNPSLELTLQGKPLSGIGNFDHRIPEAIGKNAHTINLKGLNREQTKNLLEFYKKAGLWDYSWDRSVPIQPALAKVKLTSEEYLKLRGVDVNPKSELEDLDELELPSTDSTSDAKVDGKPKDIALSEIVEELNSDENAKQKDKAIEMSRILQTLSMKPLTQHEVVERHVLTGGVPRELLKMCLRMTGSVNMPQ